MKVLRNNDLGLLIIRLSVGFLMLLHGINKLIHGIDGIAGMLQSKGIPGFIAWGVYAGEVIAPLAIMIGFRTRIAAGIFVVNMLVILFVAHPEQLVQLTKHGGWMAELPGLFLFGALALVFTGAGKYAVSRKNQWD